MPPKDRLEVELKYLLYSTVAIGQLRRTLEQQLQKTGFLVSRQAKRKYIDTYLDTPDNDLEHLGYTLRRRDTKDGSVFTLKQAQADRAQPTPGAFVRGEWQQEGRLHQQGEVHKRLADLAIRTNRLKVVAVQHVRRRSLALDGPCQAMWTIDDVVVYGRSLITYRELEVELISGDPTNLSSIQQLLDHAKELYPARMSKAMRARYADQPQDYVTAETTTLSEPSGHLSEALRQYCHLQPFADEAVHAEGIHQFRIAVRRLEAAIQLFSGDAQSLHRREAAVMLKKLMHLLGRVRDLDVQIYRQQGSPVPLGRDYLAYLERRHTTALRRLHEQLQHCSSRVIHSVEQLLDESTHNAGPSWRSLIAGVIGASASTNDPPGTEMSEPADELHQLRLTLKAVRYQLELLSGQGQAVAPTLKRLRQLQSVIGEHQDCQVSMRLLRRYQKTENARRKGVKRAIRYERAAAERLQQESLRRWASFRADAARRLASSAVETRGIPS